MSTSIQIMSDSEVVQYLEKNICSKESKAKRPQEIVDHSIVVCGIAGHIAEKIKAQGWDIDVGLVKKEALLHDIGRSKDQTIRHGYVGSQMLQKDGWGYEVSNAAANHNIITRDLSVSLGIPKQHYAPYTIEEIVLTYVDKVVTNSREVGLDGRWDYLVKKYAHTAEGDGWFTPWMAFAKPESYELEIQVQGFLKLKNGKIPPLMDTLNLMDYCFSRIEDPVLREQDIKHSLGTAGFASLIAKHKGLDKNALKTIHYGGLLHDVGRGSVWAVEHPIVGRMILQSRGYPEEVVQATTGHCIFPEELAEKLHFPKPWDQYRPHNLVDKIVTYADKRVYLDQVLPDIQTRYRIWDGKYRNGENFKLWFQPLQKGLKEIELHVQSDLEGLKIDAQAVNEEVISILERYSVSKSEAFQTLKIKDPVVVDYRQ